MLTKSKTGASIILVLFLCPLFIFSQNHPYLLEKKLLDAIQSEVSGERAWDVMSKISRFPRYRGGGEGSDYNLCCEWLASELEKLGLEEINIKKYKADGFKKYFLWDSVVGWKVKEAELWLIEPSKKLISRFSDQPVSLMEYSQGGEAESEVIYVGGGKSANDYKDRDVKGKLVFATGGGGHEVYHQAVLDRGAAGIIVGPSDREDRLQFPDLIEVTRLSPPGEEIKRARFGFALSRRQEKELLALFKADKRVKMRAKVEAELFDGEMPLVEAKITGTKFPSQEIIIMGHLDHYKPGANDNASGSAGMVEIARNILNLIKRGELEPLKRTVRFLWVPEMNGTVAYLAEFPDIKDRGIAGINLDMIGEDSALCQTNFTLTRTPASIPGYIDDVLASFFGWLEGEAFYSPLGSRYRFHRRIMPFSGGSDHIMFSDQSFSIPTPMLGHDDIFHHTSLDTPDKCDPTEMKRIISLALASTILLGNADDENAINIAQELFGQANLRITARTQASIRLLHDHAADPEKRKKLVDLFSNVMNYPLIQAQSEASNLRKIKELCEKNETKMMLDRLADKLLACVPNETDKINTTYELFTSSYNIKKEKFVPSDLYKKASSLKPQRLFKGPLPSGYLADKLKREDLLWYEKNGEKAGSNSSSKQYEIVNLMDGKHSVLDIRHFVSCEYDETDVDYILHFIDDLVKSGVAKY